MKLLLLRLVENYKGVLVVGLVQPHVSKFSEDSWMQNRTLLHPCMI